MLGGLALYAPRVDEHAEEGRRSRCPQDPAALRPHPQDQPGLRSVPGGLGTHTQVTNYSTFNTTNSHFIIVERLTTY